MKRSILVLLVCSLVASLVLGWAVAKATAADTASYPPWTEGAGFHKAMDAPRASIVLENIGSPAEDRAVAYWNRVAGWPLMSYGPNPDITFERGGWSARWGSLPPYTTCVVYYPLFEANDPTAWTAFAHELNHCLGWGDEPPHGVNDCACGKQWRYDRRALHWAGYR